MPLASYPGHQICLDHGIRYLSSRGKVGGSMQPECIVDILSSSVQSRIDALQSGHVKLLLVLPDKTRRANAANIAVDSVLSLVADARNNLTATIAYGLGSHPLMSSNQIKQLLGEQRWKRVIDLNIEILQHSTKKPLQSRSIEFNDSDLGLPPDTRSTVSLSVPDIVWGSHLVMVAGDTELHPYDKRCGSGGVNKMLIIGLGNADIINRTHSPTILSVASLSSQESTNIFTRLLDHYYEGVVASMLSWGDSSLKFRPLGFSVIKLSGDSEISDYWIGEHDENRVALTRQVAADRICLLDDSINLAICDCEALKATDILAGARTLHSLCTQNTSDNILICNESAWRMALLFNPCNEQLNNGGIGNSGTLRHLSVLQGLARNGIPAASLELRSCCDVDEVLRIVKRIKAGTLKKWNRHFDRTTNLQFLLEEIRCQFRVDRLVEDWLEEQPGWAGYKTTELEEWAAAAALPFGMLVDVAAIDNSCKALERLSDILTLHELNKFSEGGQRAMRLLSVLHCFDQLVVATDNVSVSAYISGLSAEVDSFLHPSVRSHLESRAGELGPSLLGISSIDLRYCSPQQAVERCRRAHESFLTGPQRVKAAYLREPMILRR